ncbi:glycolate oxidase subunit GlcF [Xanthobacter tagetidis]|uniref:Glycolate oxidase iron-sulfur subunit n=1 Tax=Xanthobacter tagetidis TaxID=60216 RepID=A0A3L7AMR3_9HYPH|nr:glycolate oxidase subunit GlcF [Xanthobacter tagetidis]MBB6308178.1 glycolate oxidase iron-sulfur subunit [Xanthobacter tagetidis]RLP81796.1 glycolate oxidase iron-sulfur subunit [Xanthobacter tagetidis]
MQTHFSLAQLADPRVAEANDILRKCVHCGFCTATCPTYVLLGDELDSPRGRIYLIKDMLEGGRAATEEEVKHIDRCLTCLSCMTTCPSGVNYMHLVDGARVHIEKTYRRPFADRMIRTLLAKVLPYPARFRFALLGAAVGKPFAPLLAKVPGLKPLAAMLRLAPGIPHGPSQSELPGATPAEGPRRARVALLKGCAQPVLRPGIDDAATRLLTRHGVEVVRVSGEGCCGALVHHMGREEEALAFARRNVDAWIAEMDGAGLDAIVVTASGCGTPIKDYGHMLRLDPAYADKAARVSAIARDVTEFVATLDLPAARAPLGRRVAYHAACSLQHGQKVKGPPTALLRRVGFDVAEPFESHICCGSAGTYNMLQSDIAAELKARKVGHIEALKPDIIAAGNIGCMTQIGSGTNIPVVHTVELLDWATGGPVPEGLGAAGAAKAA